MFEINAIAPIVLSNLSLVMVMTVMFVLVWLSNFCFSLYYNLVEIQENFNWKRCYQGALKAGSVLVGLLLVTTVISTLPDILRNTGIDMQENTTELISMAVILVPYASAILYYLVDATKTFKDILGSKSAEFIDDGEVEELFEGTNVATGEFNIPYMDTEEPNVIEGQIGVEDGTVDTEETK